MHRRTKFLELYESDPDAAARAFKVVIEGEDGNIRSAAEKLDMRPVTLHRYVRKDKKLQSILGAVREKRLKRIKRELQGGE